MMSAALRLAMPPTEVGAPVGFTVDFNFCKRQQGPHETFEIPPLTAFGRDDHG